MKKRIVFLAFFLTFFLLSSCSRSPLPTAGPADSTPQAAPVQPAGTPAEISFKSTVSWANWTEEPSIFFGALNSDKLAISSVHHLPIYKFDTREELDVFTESFGDILSMDGSYDEVPSFIESTSVFDETFFEKSTLMLVYVTAASGSFRFGINSIFCDGKAFCIHVEQTNRPECHTDDMAGWFLTVAVPDSMVSACTEFDADLNNLPS